MIRFDAPEWFFLIPLLVFIGWHYRGLRLGSPLRLSALLTILLCLTQPVLTRGSSGLDLWVLIDQSKSAGGRPAAATDEILSILERSKKSGDRIRLVDFGQSAVLRGKGDPVFAGGTDGTDMEEALSYTLAQMDKTRANRILMLTDGWPSTPPEHATERLISEKIPLDYRLAAPPREQDIRIEELRVPARIRPGEAFMIEARIAGPHTQGISVPWTLSRKGAPPLKGVTTLTKGVATLRLTDRLTQPGAYAYDLFIAPDKDPVTENNRAICPVEVTGGKSVLLLSGYDKDPLAPFIRAQGFKITQVSAPGLLTPADLTGAALVIINNLHASKIPAPFLQALDYYVREQGGGLLMCGGKQSFGSGGYFSSAIDAILPVSMEQKKDKMKMITAMSIVMDRSGSMATSAAGGKTKMDLATAGVCQTIRLLTEQDYVSVRAVATAPHSIVTMMPVGENRERMLTAASRIEATGGGIYVGKGIKAGWEELRKTPVGTKHMILFADAEDAEEPADYKQTIAAMVADGATLSVIALGKETASDAPLLKEIAQLGQGRIFFCDNPADIPAVFEQETVTVARSTYIAETTPIKGTPGWRQIAADAPAWPQTIDAYNLCYLREGATAACLSDYEHHAPILAFRNRGLGRVAANTAPMGGIHAISLLEWPNYGDHIQTLTRWLSRKDPPPGYSLQAEMKGERLILNLHYNDTALPQLAKAMPTVTLNERRQNQFATRQGVWERMQPGLFRCEFKLSAGVMVRGAVRIGQATIPFGPLSVLSSPEWAMSAENRDAFLRAVSLTGGQERLELPGIFSEPVEHGERPLLPYLLWCALALLLTDALTSKLGILPDKGANKNAA